MVTVAYFLSLKDGLVSDDNGGEMVTPHKMKKAIAGPDASPIPGYFPQAYTVEYDASTNVYRVALVDLEMIGESDFTNPTPIRCGPPPAV